MTTNSMNQALFLSRKNAYILRRGLIIVYNTFYGIVKLVLLRMYF